MYWSRSFGFLPLLSVALLWQPGDVAAYNPPVDEAGPLRATIVGPDELTSTSDPISITVELENRGDQPLSGHVELQVIDDWRVVPDKVVEFSAPAKQRVKKVFSVHPGPATYNAHYPVHALAKFELNGQKRTAHPILILEAKHTRSPRPPSPLPWKPLQLSGDSTLALWQLPVRRTVVEVFGEKPVVLPVGQSGSEARSRADVSLADQTLDNDARSVVAMHPPWYDGHAGTVAVEYPLILPSQQAAKLSFANAMSPGGQSDGVTFRVRVVAWKESDRALGDVLFEHHTDAKSWQEAEVDLSQFAGQAIRLQLESHPGPSKNTGWDRCFWAEPLLEVGSPAPTPPFPPATDNGFEPIGTARCGDASYQIRVRPGNRGLLDAAVEISDGTESLYFQGLEVTVLGARLDQPGCPLQLTDVQRESVAGGIQCRHAFDSPFGSFDLVSWLGVKQDVLQVQIFLENGPAPLPWTKVRIEDMAIGRWSHVVKRVYAGAGNVVVDPEAYQLSFDGHRLSTSFVGYDFEGSFSLVEGSNTPPLQLDVRPQRFHASLHATDTQIRTLIPTRNVWTGVRTWRTINGLTAAGGVSRVAGRFVFDLWGGRYGAHAADLKKAFRYGLTDAMVVWHNWQRWGYDYRLPEIYPPNPQFGTHEELKKMVESCGQADVLFALHDNYIDYYPDAEGFSYDSKIAFRQDATPVRAWLNEGREAQSYRYRTDCVEPILKNNVRVLGKELAPSAYFIDVWSSVRPYEYWTADGDYFSATYSRRTWGELFAWIRDELGNQAPQISESGHDQLIGWLDGAQTNHLRVGKPLPGRYQWSVWNWNCADAERIAWFDAAHHDRFVLHGAGYGSRYVAGLNTKLHGMYSDDYIATEMLTGHPAMVSRPFGRDVVRKYWLTQGVSRSLALQTIEDVTFVGGDIHRQLVRWSGGGRVWVNRGEADWTVDGVTLPQYGFLARVPMNNGEVVAAVERLDGLIVERCLSPKACYVNARSPQGQAWPIEVTMEQLRYSSDRKFEMRLRWKTEVPVPAGWLPFLHFCDSKGDIVFQGAHRGPDITQGVIQSTAVCSVPEKCQPGEIYELCFGLYNPTSGTRLTLAGPDAGDQRIRLGKVRLDGQRDRLAGVSWVPYRASEDPVLMRQNVDGRNVDFGQVTTKSGCRLAVDQGQLVVTPLPSVSPERFDVAIRWDKLPWRLPEPGEMKSVDEQGKVLARTPIRAQHGLVTIRCDGKAFEYRLAP